MSKLKFNPRLLPVIAALSTPPLSVFIVLVASGHIDLGPALLGTAATVVLTGLLLYPYGADLAEVTRYARDLGNGVESAPPALRTGLAADVLAALGQLRRTWRAHNGELATLVRFHENLVESLPGPLFLLNRQRRIVRANLAARTIFGRQLQGRDLAALLRNPALLDATDRVLKGEPGCDVEIALRGTAELDFRAMLEPLTEVGSDGTVAVLTLHDVTALKRMEQMRADFVANASHELRTPLSALLGFIETLRGPARDDKEAHERFLTIMFDQASRMSRLVADLLNLSRIELNEHTRPANLTDIGEIVQRVADGLELQAKQRKMRITLDLPADLPAVKGQEDELEQIFQNLMDNALKYGRQGSTVWVSAKVATDLPVGLAGRTERAIGVAVRDEGEGIEREHLPRLTERFFRVDPARSRQLGGTGLGLAIVKHLVNRHRGILTIDSTIGVGSTFTVYLPFDAV
ncbi:ATP-binding protein [Telmatospirillum sp.]|uniref:ATP-binding protein n=1 Tax=Telmatospirillum sp. TaxID=2079197 RepID=UPI002849E85B|nr:ATP-binding protein [Telmatospirillum sp.]MDR3440398.1 ATP-binding protein [Telmatospirillum sp.]